jgi:pyruvate dehydrogenase E1 component
MNLFSLLGALGMADRHHGERLLPIGTLYDPFVCRGLDAFIHAVYSGSRFVVAGTPSGVTLAPEGGAHQSTITASIGLELPNVTFAEPTYVGALDWLLSDAIGRIANDEDAEALYLRLTTRELDQEPFEQARSRVGEETLRDHVLAGGYVLREGSGDGPALCLLASGAVMPEVLEAADELANEGVRVRVVDVTSLDRLYRDWRSGLTDDIRGGHDRRHLHHLARLLAGCDGPVVTVHDAASHAMAWVGAATGQVVVPLGVDQFGQSGTIPDLYRANDLQSDAIVNAALLALTRGGAN